ncbi:hypothetical protein PSHT_09608 [Puccinia striiformis]|uniref:Uncharacterized protein n=3 Tax=Puccinia striiformis TaxID=27350 RepID=A0A2S4VFH7_9BASI|nr:hypothetical protein PSHT_09608 [Puccinia striiformis]
MLNNLVWDMFKSLRKLLIPASSSTPCHSILVDWIDLKHAARRVASTNMRLTETYVRATLLAITFVASSPAPAMRPEDLALLEDRVAASEAQVRGQAKDLATAAMSSLKPGEAPDTKAISEQISRRIIDSYLKGEADKPASSRR